MIDTGFNGLLTLTMLTSAGRSDVLVIDTGFNGFLTLQAALRKPPYQFPSVAKHQLPEAGGSFPPPQ